jgi:hypothetical protein
MGPGLEENLLSQASTYVRNIQTGKSKKLFFIRRKVPRPVEKSQQQPHTYLRNIEKAKKEKKSWYQYVFLGLARENEAITCPAVSTRHVQPSKASLGIKGIRVIS